MQTELEKEFVPFDESKALHELGFDLECLRYWNYYRKDKNTVFKLSNLIDDWSIDYVLAPTFSQAFRWFRKNYRLHSEITVGVKGFTFLWRPYYDINGKNPNNSVFDIESFKGQFVWFESFEEAELSCLQKLIELCKQN